VPHCQKIWTQLQQKIYFLLPHLLDPPNPVKLTMEIVWTCAKGRDDQCLFFLWDEEQAQAKQWMEIHNPQPPETPSRKGKDGEGPKSLEMPWAKAKRKPVSREVSDENGHETGNAEPSKEKDGGSEETRPRATKQGGENSVGEYLYSGHAGDIISNDAVAFLDELGNKLAPLDAGYRSDDDDRDDESVLDNEQQSTNAPIPTGPATDSGYASAGKGPDDPKDEEDQDDTRTVFTNSVVDSILLVLFLIIRVVILLLVQGKESYTTTII
jgi:hypothetical protein